MQGAVRSQDATEGASDEPAAAEATQAEPAADEPADEPAGGDAVAVEGILSGLDNPSGVAIQPETGCVFVSDSAAGRIVSFNPADAQPVEAAITGFPQDEYGKGPIFKIGPLGMVFLDRDTLVVGGGELVDGQELVRVYDLSAGTTLGYEDMEAVLGPLGPSEQTLKGEGNFYDLAASRTAIYITSNGDDTKGWVLRIAIEGSALGELTPFIATKELTAVDAPVGIELNHNGQLVVGQMGEVNVPQDSLYTVYDPETGELMHAAETGLYDIAALAYSPTTRNLYALDFAWMDTTQGGLFRLDVHEDGTVEAVKIAPLDKPTAMTFADNGDLYITLYGTPEEGSDKKPGRLVRVRGL
jgi:hypothetical protein